MEKKLLERKIDHLRWLIKHHLESEVKIGKMTALNAQEIARLVNKNITLELPNEGALNNAIDNVLTIYPNLSEDMQIILEESSWEDKRLAVDYYILPLIKSGKTDEALLLIENIINQ